MTHLPIELCPRIPYIALLPSCFELSEDSGKTPNPKVPVAAKVDVVVHAKIVLRLPSPKHSRLYERLRVLTLLGILKP